MRAAKNGDCKMIRKMLLEANDRNDVFFQDALCVAVSTGQEPVIRLMLEMGVDPKFIRPNADFIERFTPLGHAIAERRYAAVQILLQAGCPVDKIYHKEREPGAIDLYFDYYYSTKGPDPQLLRLILAKKPNLKSLNHKTIFKIGAFATTEELELLIEAGLDPEILLQEEENVDCKGKDQSWAYRSEINLLDIAVIQAEKLNFFKKDPDSIAKVQLLIRHGVDPKKCNNECNQNYLHQVTHPILINLLCHAGVDVKAEAKADKFKNYIVRPINKACNPAIIETLCTYGESRENSPYLKGTKAHQQALERIGFISGKGLDQKDKDGIPLLIKAVKEKDIPAIVALIGEGVDVNQRTGQGASWTALHWLFSDISHASGMEYNFFALAEDIDVRIIKLLIQNGAKPIKDEVGRTPLMCLTFNGYFSGSNKYMIADYIDFEAEYYKIDTKEYREKFDKLRDGGFESVYSVAVPLKEKLDRFWSSFEEHLYYTPKTRINPVEDWNNMRAEVEGKDIIT